MTERDDRFNSIRGHVQDAHDKLHLLDEAQREAHAAELTRLEEVIAYAALVLDATDPNLISTSAFTAIQSAASNISGNPLAALQSGGAQADALLDAIALLPSARGRDMEQQAKDAAATFQRSASQRLSSVDSRLGGVRRRLETLEAAVDARATELQQQIEQRAAGFEPRVAEAEQTVVTQRQAFDQLMTQQSSAFTKWQEERSAEFQEALEGFRTELARTEHETAREVEERVSEIRRMEHESAQLVGAIGLAGTAERYSEEAREQCRVANRFRTLTIIFALAAVAVAIVAAVREEQSAEALAAKLAVSLILAGLAAYSARQSGRHRAREEHSRSLQLELTAFSPFIEPLSPEQREEERVIMTRKTFGKTTPPQAAEEEPGPAPLSALLRRREQEAGP
jgi:VIT1/CCC1 family predicted Fe2+/Mn2+ transporter